MVFAGCSNSSGQNVETSNSSSSANQEAVSTDSSTKDNEANNDSSEESPKGDLNDASSETNVSDQRGDEKLSQYSSEQIEYARVWLQFGPNQEIDELNVLHIPTGTPINPDDESSADYPEDVIQLAGSRLVDGSVTYSGNGDGTINVYNVPLRWDGNYPADEDFYTDIIENTKLVNVEIGDDEKIIKLIKLLNIPS